MCVCSSIYHLYFLNRGIQVLRHYWGDSEEDGSFWLKISYLKLWYSFEVHLKIWATRQNPSRNQIWISKSGLIWISCDWPFAIGCSSYMKGTVRPEGYVRWGGKWETTVSREAEAEWWNFSIFWIQFAQCGVEITWVSGIPALALDIVAGNSTICCLHGFLSWSGLLPSSGARSRPRAGGQAPRTPSRTSVLLTVVSLTLQ